MAGKKRGLGRGLDALLGAGNNMQSVGSEAHAGSKDAMGGEDSAFKELPVDLIQSGKYQPRREIEPESLRELADSIIAQGLMQPIVVRPISDQKYEIIAGERRWRAMQLAGSDVIPAVIRDVSDQAAIAMALMRRLLEHGDLEMGHARALLGLEGSDQSHAARTVVGKGLTVRQTEALVRNWSAKKTQPAPDPSVDPNIRHLQDDLSQRLGASVKIQHSAKGKGKLVLHYNSLDELDGILSHIK